MKGKCDCEWLEGNCLCYTQGKYDAIKEIKILLEKHQDCSYKHNVRIIKKPDGRCWELKSCIQLVLEEIELLGEEK